MYRCQVCGTCSEARQPRLLHVIHRQVPHVKWDGKTNRQIQSTRLEIAREIPVCRECKNQLDNGIPLSVLKSDGETSKNSVDRNGVPGVRFTLFNAED